MKIVFVILLIAVVFGLIFTGIISFVILSVAHRLDSITFENEILDITEEEIYSELYK